jgi:O-antigen ligase
MTVAVAPRLDLLLAALLAALGLFLPFSVAATSAVMALLLLSALVLARAWWNTRAWRHPVMLVGLALLAFIAARSLASEGDGLRVAMRYRELFFAVVLLGLFRLTTWRGSFLAGLGAGSVLYAAVHWVGLARPELAKAIEPHRISAGFIFAVTAFLMLRQAAATGWPRLWWAAALFLAVTVPVVGGRTGYLVLFLLATCAAWLHAPRQWRWYAILLVPLLIGALALGSAPARQRLAESLAGSQPMADGTLSPTGIRIELVRNGMELARRYWVAGAGYGQYSRVHKEVAQERYAADPQRRHYLGQFWVASENPHSEYVMQLVGGGIAALGLFLAWLALPLIGARRGGARTTLSCVALAFALGCVFNSMLMDFVEAHFYVAVLAWLLSAEPAAA